MSVHPDPRCNPCHDGCGCVQDEMARLEAEIERLTAERDALPYTVIVAVRPIARFRYGDQAQKWAERNYSSAGFSVVDATRKAGERTH